MKKRFIVNVDVEDTKYNADALRGLISRSVIVKNIRVSEIKPQARWIEKEYGMYYECSSCGNLIDIPSRYCKECGARMHDVGGH